MAENKKVMEEEAVDTKETKAEQTCEETKDTKETAARLSPVRSLRLATAA